MAGRKYDKCVKKKNIEYNFIFVKSNGQQLRERSKIIDKNHIVPAIDSTIFTLDQINEAIEFSKSGKTKDKVIVK
ncbi:zinc-binding dehydrogenase [Companilactobacillus sp. DQM5]|uniref:zinc-binding dehydrogenase n=1 Tax=Companilactobacillus sp. DQM5 TaxID=3463359 RepID=UPI004058AAED